MQPAWVGQPMPRVDGAAKVTGAARYLDDLALPDGAWHGVTVRSNVAHGVLEGFDRDPSFDWSQVVVVTAADLPWGKGWAAGGLGHNHVALIEDDQPALVAIGAPVMHWDEPL